jgi:hypothetical protein
MVVSTLSELSPRVSLAQRAISPICFASSPFLLSGESVPSEMMLVISRCRCTLSQARPGSVLVVVCV